MQICNIGIGTGKKLKNNEPKNRKIAERIDGDTISATGKKSGRKIDNENKKTKNNNGRRVC